MSRHKFSWEYVLYLLMIATLMAAVASFINLGRFNRYMADDYCHSAALKESGFISAQTNNYFFWGGRFTYAALMSAAESIGPKTAAVGPPLCLALWLMASIWALYEIAAINRCRRPFLMSCLGASLIVFAMLDAADNLVQSVYWEAGYLLYSLPLVLVTGYVGIVAFAVRRSVRGMTAGAVMIAVAALTLIAGGINEPYTFAQTAGHLLALAVCYFSPQASARRRALPFLIAGLVGSLIAAGIMVSAPGNRVRQSLFPVSRDLLTVIGLTIRGTCGFILRKFVQVPLTTVMLCAIPAYVSIRYYKSAAGDSHIVTRRLWRYLILLPLAGFLLVFVCYLPGVYGAGGLVARARSIPEFVFVCTAIGSAFFVGALLARAINHERIPALSGVVTLAVIAAITLTASSRTTWRVLKLATKAKANAALWDQTDSEIRIRKAQGLLDQTIPAIDDIETSLGGPQTELHVERDPANWKNQCVARYYGINSIRTR